MNIFFSLHKYSLAFHHVYLWFSVYSCFIISVTFKKDQEQRHYLERQLGGQIGITTGDGKEFKRYYKSKIENSVYISFLGAVGTKHHERKIGIYCHISGGKKSEIKCQQDQPIYKSSRGNPSFPLPRFQWWLAIPGFSYIVIGSFTSLLPSSHSPCLCLQHLCIFSHLRGSVIDVQTDSNPVWPHRTLMTLAKTLFPAKVTFTSTRG